TIQFDPVSSTQVSTMLTGAVAASPGWFGTDYLPATTSGCVLYGDPLNRKATVLIGAGDRIGDGAEIRIQIDTGITNPAEIADYTLSIATSQEPNPVSSDPYSIAAPYVAPMPGIVEVFNPEGIKVYSANGPSAIQACLDKATSPGYMVEIGPGTYSENPVFLSGGTAVLAAGSAEETIVKGQWTIAVTDAITKKPTIIQGLTLEPAGGKVIAVNAGGDRITVKDCLIRKKSVFVPDTEGPETLITINADQVMVQNCSIDTTAGQAWDTGILVEETGPIFGTTITGCSFNLDMSSFYADDCGIDVFGGGRVTVTGCTFTGNSGIGYRNLSESYTFDSITGNAFTGLSKAVYYYNSSGQLTLKENTITGSTVAPVATAITATGAVELYGFSRVTMERNTLADNNGYSLIIGDAADPTQVSMAGNILSGNVYGTKNRNLTGMLDAILNYWGDPSGPTTVDNPGGTGDPIAGPSAGGGPIEYRPWLNAPVTSIKADQTISDGGTLDKSTTVGISYTSTCAVNGVSLMRYAANPGPSNPPYPVLEEGYYGVDSPNAACTTTLLFYNPNITQDSKVYYYDTLRRVWVMCSDQGVAGDGAYVYTVIQNYGNPSNANLGGAIFALVDQKSIPEAPYLGVPCVGEYDVPIEPVFAWGAVPGAVRYEITVSDDPSFTTIAFSHNVEDFTFYKTSAGEALDPNTTYYWKVRGILEDSYDPGTPATAYSVGIFTTESSTAFRGDVNGDGFVNVLDMTLIARIILGLD
ncbi:MAG: right-handed parallel beta-helix repeat-containing protein, partial [Dehalococcoidales bacterium]|nr:right-handed parallel beta-helix repeat-containing protein [Dehalococcoidales bacterium]